MSLVATLSEDGGYAGSKGRIILFFVLVAIQVLVFGVILCALGVVYILGLFISAGVSLWRLMEHDFGDAGGADQRPALRILYILAVAQGVLFSYKAIYARVTRSRLADAVARGSRVDQGLIEEYIEETLAGCEKNLSFASGRNFVTYGVDLIVETKSNEGFIAGIRVLGGAIKSTYPRGAKKVLLKYLLTRSDFSSAIIQRLLETVGPRSPYSREIKEDVVRILDIIAPCILLEQFPRAIECLCSVVDTSEEQIQSDSEDIIILWNHTDQSRRYGNQFKEYSLKKNKFKDYERVDLLEEYEKDYIESDSEDIRCFDLSSTLEQWLYQIQHCFLGKRKKVENVREENIRRGPSGFDPLLIKATDIIQKLIAHEENRWIMRACVSSTVLHKIAMLPTKLHRENHEPCRANEKSELQMLEQCWVLTEWLLLVAVTDTSNNSHLSQPATPTPVGEGLYLRSMVGSALGSLIESTIKDSIVSTIKCIFDCLDCRATQKRQAIQILLHLSLDMSFVIKDSESSKRRLRWILLLILCSTDDDSKYWMVPSLTYRNNNCCYFDGIRRKARQKLWDMLPAPEKHGLHSEETATESQLVGLALGDLKSAFSDVAQDISIRTHAVIIMKGLCADYTRYSEVRKFLVGAIPEVVTETLICCESKTAERQEQATDVEKGNVSQDNQDGCKDSEQLRKALASLCYFGYMDSNYTMRSKFVEIASKTCEEQGKSFEDFDRLIRQAI